MTDQLRQSFAEKSRQLADVIARTDSQGAVRPAPAAPPDPSTENNESETPTTPPLSQGRRGDSANLGPKSLDQRIAEAEMNGDVATAIRLKAARTAGLLDIQHQHDARRRGGFTY